jgi:RNA polymerase sigma-70 factor, ECF subfamily
MGAVAIDRVEAVYRSVHARLWRSLLVHTGDAELASDAEAEAFAQVLRRGEAVRDVEAWVWRAAYRIADGLLERRGRERALEPHHDAAAERDPAVVELLDLLGGLSAQQRACVVLHYVAGLPAGRIAEVLDTSPGTVRVQLHHARERLRRDLEVS